MHSAERVLPQPGLGSLWHQPRAAVGAGACEWQELEPGGSCRLGSGSTCSSGCPERDRQERPDGLGSDLELQAQSPWAGSEVLGSN